MQGTPIQFVYSHRPPRRVRSTISVGRTTVVLREVPASSARDVAAIKLLALSPATPQYRGRAVGTSYSLYQIDGGLWWEWGGLSDFEAACHSGYGNHTPLEPYFAEMKRFGAQSFKDEATAVALISGIVNRCLVVVDGTVLERVREPYLQVGWDGQQDRPWVTLRLPGHEERADQVAAPPRVPFHCCRERIDRLNELLSRLLASGHPAVSFDFQINLHDAVDHWAHPLCEALLASVRAELLGLVGDLGGLPADQLSATIELRDAFVADASSVTSRLRLAISRLAGMGASALVDPGVAGLHGALAEASVRAGEWLKALEVADGSSIQQEPAFELTRPAP